MEEATDTVTLNIYELQPDDETRQQHSAAVGFFSRILTPMGMGAYHTSITVRDYTYTFGAGAGITKTNSTNEYLPPTATFHSSIPLGSCIVESQSDINQIILHLREYFHGTSYHLLNRNCNHFTETFALALIHSAPELCGVPKKKKLLEKYPNWINRLAKSGTSFVNHGDVCDALEEAKAAVKADEQMAVENFTNMTNYDTKESGKKASSGSSSKSKGKKKELTEKQKAALAKLKQKK